MQQYLRMLLKPVTPLLLALCAMLQRDDAPCRRQRARMPSKPLMARPTQPPLTAAARVNQGRAYIHKHFSTY